MRKSNFNQKILALLSSGVVLASGTLVSCGDVNEETSSKDVTTSTMGDNTTSKTTTTSNSTTSKAITTTSKATTTKKKTTTKAPTTTTKKKTTTQVQNNGGNTVYVDDNTNNNGYVDNNGNNNDYNNNDNQNTTTQRPTTTQIPTTTQQPTTTTTTQRPVTTTTQAPQPSGPSEEAINDICNRYCSEFYDIIMESINAGNDPRTVSYMMTYYSYINLGWSDSTDYYPDPIYFNDLPSDVQRKILNAGIECEELAMRWCVDYQKKIGDEFAVYDAEFIPLSNIKSKFKMLIK